MSSWTPATLDEVAVLLEDSVARLHTAHQSRFAAMRVQFRTVPVDAHPGESVVVVAEHEGRLLYWSDVEEGWELDSPTPSGGILERGASQFELEHIMWQLFGDPRDLG